ncbi:HD domain-containing protein [Ekhidna sp.]|uniref:HD domain-containing protein n=1 Tax=Ekhidna sp. TaxID=2608089 RepID=UPI0035178F20
MISESTIIEVKQYTNELLISLDHKYLFHNWNHTQEVVKVSMELGKQCGLSEKDLSILKVAAYFHDTGHVKSYTNHEEMSARIAAEFLEIRDVAKEEIETVKSLILSTKLTSPCLTTMEEILHDADLSHIGTLDMERRAKALRKEWEYLLGSKYSEREWLELQISFLSHLRFLTEPAKIKFEPILRIHIGHMKKKLFDLSSKEK